MELFGKNLKALRKQYHLRCVNRNLACFGFENGTLDIYYIADIHFLKGFIFILAYAVTGNIRLYTTL